MCRMDSWLADAITQTRAQYNTRINSSQDFGQELARELQSPRQLHFCVMGRTQPQPVVFFFRYETYCWLLV